MSDLDFYFGMNVLKGFSLLALLGDHYHLGFAAARARRGYF